MTAGPRRRLLPVSVFVVTLGDPRPRTLEDPLIRALPRGKAQWRTEKEIEARQLSITCAWSPSYLNLLSAHPPGSAHSPNLVSNRAGPSQPVLPQPAGLHGEPGSPLPAPPSPPSPLEDCGSHVGQPSSHWPLLPMSTFTSSVWGR